MERKRLDHFTNELIQNVNKYFEKYSTFKIIITSN